MRTLYHPNVNEIRLSSILYALSDKIVMELTGRGEQSCSALDIPIANSTLFHHFKVLRESGGINTKIDGTQRFISIRKDDIENRFPGLLQAILQASEPF
ncbi:ArsR/SmtB family transcription factor [Bacillus cereus group sp. MYBK217-2]|uniref:ArsR/SmtB family transcription factor n=1 Tax=Bacillus cereus group sp. MYBK217-2 TaxID=3450661 RepID=UPI003F7AB256